MAVGVRLLSTRQLHGDAFTGVFPGGAYGLLVLNEQLPSLWNLSELWRDQRVYRPQ